MSAAGLQPGTIFAERYKIVRCIAHGGMGAVYEVVHLETERRRALKVMLPHVLASAELRQRFQREAKIAANVESEFIVDVFDAGYDEPTEMPFLVMELLRGEEVSKRLKRLGRLPPLEVAAIVHQTALALDRTHKASIVHRDLKPENLFLTEREDGPPRVKVLDFGIAKVVAESATLSGITQSIGTPLYMAPEQFNPSASLTGAADLYALAMVAYKLLVGRAYWTEEAKGGNVFALAAVAIHGPRQPASQRALAHGVALTPAFDAWFARAAAREPARRFPSGAEMALALAEALGVASVTRAQSAPSLGMGVSPSFAESAASLPAAPPVMGLPTPAGSGTWGAERTSGGGPPLAPLAMSPAPNTPDPASHAVPNLTAPTPLPTSLASISMPSLPTHIAVPATSGATPQAPGLGLRALAAVALGATLTFAIGAWAVLRSTSGARAEPASGGAPPVTASAAPSAAPEALSPVPSASAEASPLGAPTAEPSVATAASAPSALAAASPTPAPTAARPATKPAVKKRYTRD